MQAGPALADNSELCASIVLPFAKYSIFDFPMFNKYEECMAKIGSFPKNRKLFKNVSCFLGNIIIFVAINR